MKSKELSKMVRKSVLALVSLFVCVYAFAQVGPGGYTPRSIQSVTDGTTTSYPWQIEVSPGDLSCVAGKCTINTSGSGVGSPWTRTAPYIYPTTITDNVGVGTTIPQGGLVVMNGNVGIGTWKPATLFETVFPDNGKVQIYENNTVGALNLLNGTSSYIKIQDNGFEQIYGQTANRALAFGVGNAEKMRIDGTGNVGIGSTNPGQALDVQGTVRTSLGLDIQGTLMPFLDVDANGNIGIGTNARQNSLAIMKGNVGIGTWAPFGALDIQGTIQQTAFVVTGNGNVGIGTSTTSQALTVMNGNVGIGTTIAPNQIYVKGDVFATGNLHFNGNFQGGVTGNVGIGTTQTGAGATCDSSCNAANQRCFLGIKTVTVGIEPCSVSIVGDCVCLPA